MLNLCVVWIANKFFPFSVRGRRTQLKRKLTMKLKAVLFDNPPSALVAALEKIRPDVMGEVLVPHLKVPQDFGPESFMSNVPTWYSKMRRSASGTGCVKSGSRASQAHKQTSSALSPTFGMQEKHSRC